MMLPDNTFFRPTAAWWRWLDETLWMRYKAHVDVGAGMGQLTEAMVEHDYDCTGIDILPRPGQSDMVIQEDATERSWNMNECLLIARPCHSPWLDKVLKYSVGHCEVLYIGLDKNLENDLSGWCHEKIAEGVGEDGEHIWRVLAHEDRYEEWCKIHPDFWRKPNWMLYDGKWFRNSAGGGFPREDIEILDSIRLTHGDQIYSTYEDLVTEREREGERNGWIAPCGRFWAVPSRLHDPFLKYVLGINEAHAEDLGFVRCYGSDHSFYTHKDTPSRAQLRRLTELDYDIKLDFEELRRTE